MTIAALITWIVAASGGLFMLTIWLIEYEGKKDGGPGTRLPVAALSGHVLLAVTGLVVWIGYLYADDDRLARAALVVLAAVALLGLTMLRRWVSVYRDSTYSLEIAAAREPGLAPALVKVPAERHFPLAVVIGHGVFALATITLVLLTVLQVGGTS
jgi:manganese efflux pump family protein